MSGLTDEERELKRLAEGADKEKWRTYSHDRRYVENENGDSIAEAFVGSGSGYAARVANAEFIAAANPATVLRLLARIEELEGRVRNDDYRVGLQRWCERPVVDATGKHGGPCSLEIDHEDGCEHWVNGRHPPMTPK